ncbi:MAG TPA: hypothetical protein PKV44_07120 [Bacillota bacterium]|nr:hypothetical protein [Bacillota bacterium]HPE38267.1 hypothetical protein [Bacillota bacterium]
MDTNPTDTSITPENIRVENTLIEGDLFSGIAVSNYEDINHSFTLDGHEITVIQRVTRPQDNRLCVGFLFLLDQPTRFRLDVLIPEDAKNGQVSLNDHELIGFWSPDIPENPEYVIMPHCNDSKKISTLHPGEYQSINFKWQSGDVLKFFFYY